MTVRDVGEFGLIRLLQEMVERADAASPHLSGLLTLGIGDDAAAWTTDPGTELATTDTMVEDVHFRHTSISWEELGWKALAVNLSDIAAMGGLPTYALVTLGLRDDTQVEDVKALYRGLLASCGEYGCRIIGGDVVHSPVDFLTVALTGVAPGPMLTRSAARPGDAIAVTGPLGCSAGGLRAVNEGTRLTEAVRLHLHMAHVRPIPKVREGQMLVAEGVRSAMDISDGLTDDLTKLCQASGVGAVINAHQMPVDGFLREAFPNDFLQMALAGGEDYHLLFTGSDAVVDRALAQLDPAAAIIGRIVAEHPGQVRVVDQRGGAVELDRTGWDHFR